MKKIENISQAKLDIKKSTFIAYICNFKEYKELLNKLKEEHTKAVHFVYAYRFLNEHKQIVEDKSDDFEPKNSAGLPCLNALRGADLIDSAVIVVRYFGGIKLGVGGLIRAYFAATNLAIQNAKTVDFELKDEFSFKLNIKFFNKFKHKCVKNNISFDSKFNNDDVFIRLSINDKEKSLLKEFLSF
ncbi:YigZ family protein [uncultured Campylobacter sp.]|uniref:IMPACT family protein n=1 Tax=uncultured Campylobacter sp. TaxID=218934 RepID=UPI002633A4A4|nr:YigZ family protein [uncultured Campylobacter sp.]